MALTKALIVKDLNERIGLNKQESKELVNAFFKELSDNFVNGEAVKLAGFGNFVMRDKSERLGRNPKTGIESIISARRVVTFKSGDKLKLQVKDHQADHC